MSRKKGGEGEKKEKKYRRSVLGNYVQATHGRLKMMIDHLLQIFPSTENNEGGEESAYIVYTHTHIYKYAIS